MSVNSCSFYGRAGADAEIQLTRSNTRVCRFSLAVTEKRGDGFQTSWIPCVLFGPSADLHGPRIKKGTTMRVFGKIEVSEYQDKQGKKVKSISCIVFRAEFPQPVGEENIQSDMAEEEGPLL